MAKQFEIAQVTINDKDLIDSLTTTKKLIDELNKSQKNMKDAGDTSNEMYIKQEAQLKSLKKEYSDNIKVLQSTSNATENLNTSLAKENRSVDEAIKNNKELRLIRNQLDTTTKEGALAVEAINDKINENTEFINDNGSALEQLKNNVGNYTQSVLNANPILGGMVTALTAVKTALYGKKAAMDAGTKSTLLGSTALRTFTVALASTGIGLIVIALGAMIGYLTQTQEGLNKLNRFLRPLKEMLSETTEIVYGLGKKLVEAFNSPLDTIKKIGSFIQENIMNRIKAVGVIIKAMKAGDWDGVIDGVLQAGTGVESLRDKFGNLLDKSSEFYDRNKRRSDEMSDIDEKLSAGKAKFIDSQAKLNEELEKEKLIAEDTNNSFEERNRAYEKSQGILKKINAEQRERIGLELKLLEMGAEAKTNTDAENDAIAEKRAELNKANAETYANERALVKKTNALHKENDTKIESDRKARAEAAKTAQKKALDDYITDLDEELALYEAMNHNKKLTDDERIAQIEETNRREKKILDVKLKNNLISETKYKTDVFKLEQNLINAKADIAQKDLDNIKSFNEKKKELERNIYEAGLADDAAKAQYRIDKKLEDDIAELEALALHEDKKAELIALKKAEHKIAADEIKEKSDKETQEKEYATAMAKLAFEEKVAQARLDIAQGLAGFLSAVMGESAEAQIANLLFEKGIAASQIIISTQVANAKAILESPLTGGMPWVAYNNVMMGIGLATVAAQTVTGIGKIKKSGKSGGSDKKFARGGILRGKSHAGGGIPTPYGELEGDEAIINKRSTAMFGPILSALNQAGGGASFGIAGTESNGNAGLINYDLLAAKMAQANMSLPSPVVSVQEIDTVGKRVSVAENNASF